MSEKASFTHLFIQRTLCAAVWSELIDATGNKSIIAQTVVTLHFKCCSALVGAWTYITSAITSNAANIKAGTTARTQTGMWTGKLPDQFQLVLTVCGTHSKNWFELNLQIQFHSKIICFCHHFHSFNHSGWPPQIWNHRQHFHTVRDTDFQWGWKRWLQVPDLGYFDRVDI